MALTIFLSLLLFLFPVLALSSVEFIFNGFNETQLRNSGGLDLEEATVYKPNGALRLTNTSQNVIGHAFYSQPIQPKNSSFSTHFVFAIVTQTLGQGGYGLAFTIAPSTKLPGAEPEHYLGLFNRSNDGNSTNHIFAVEFDTVNGHNENTDSKGNHVGININSMRSVYVEPAAYYDPTKEEITLESGSAIQAWIEYDAVTQLVNVTICPMWRKKPPKPLISHPLDNISTVFTENMYVGFSASTGEKKSSHYILGWSFSMNGVATPLNLSLLPEPPAVEKRSSSSFKLHFKILIAVLSAVLVLFLGLLLCFKLYRRITQFEILEDWELDCPHRFRYRDLHIATKGFKETELLGVGGFGAVYKGVLPSTGSQVAVKKISPNSIQGIREFAAEIECLGRLRHKHLVNLRGWCKRKNDLLLVYDYIPNGSLDFLLFDSKNNIVLSWEHRVNIIKGVASGLLYLHEEWEQVVIHRDVKSSNVLIDVDMNARLGDFGLARLYDHGQLSHTTNVVGTVGYIALELARTGKASTRTDVYAYGVLLLEVATGKRPLESDNFILVDWVLEFQQLGQILDVVDPKLGSDYAVEEMELMLGLGLLCCHHIPEARPTMRQVLRYLNGDDLLPLINWSSVNSQRSEMSSGFLEINSKDYSHISSSMGVISATSLDAAGR
ncbi:lectin-domain containing receptor kinase VI.4-like [Pistacia vera]|uniref:lectin-domain containing receptor kinase VI.4-like n=1 Tax=Pistacia vera TaxID=55513 RepID=UPI001262F82D|nr:lectin-domain containing receptor kinase VI.4-like [Pistacia vera]